MDELQKVKKFLRQWESEFLQEHKRRPSKVGLVICNDHSVRGKCGQAGCGSSLKTGLARPGKTRPGSLKILQQLIHMNLSN